MAANKQPPVVAEDPLVTMTKETLEHIDGIKKELDQASGDLDALESLGIESSRLRERIEWGYKAREVILARFGQKK